MSNLKKYYRSNSPRAFTFLEFGAIDIERGTKTIWDFRLHQEAYDLFMVGRYLKDMTTFRRLTRELDHLSIDEQLILYRDNVHTRDISNAFSKLAIFQVLQKRQPRKNHSFVELGSTLLGAIDAMEYLQAVGRSLSPEFSSIDLQEIEFCGIDISPLLNEIAVDIHPNYRITTYEDVSEFHRSVDMFFSKGVSLLYAIRDELEFVDLLQKAEISLFDYTFSLGDKQEDILAGTGKNICFLSLPKFLSQAKSRLPTSELYLQRETTRKSSEQNRLSAICYFGKPELIQETIEEERRIRTTVFNAIRDPELKGLVFDYKFFPAQIIQPSESDYLPALSFLT